jgi:glycosyltransferase involved in cell wall biosynthesis
LTRDISITLAISTYNRADSLRETLASVLPQIQAAKSCDLLVVLNNCTDHTLDVLVEFDSTYDFNHINEPEQGLAACRNAALRNTSSSYVLFCDDDITLCPGFIEAYEGAISRYRGIGFVGGRIKPRWNGARPAWVRDESMSVLAGLFGYYNLGSDVRLYGDHDPLPFGANFGISRELVSAVGEFDTRFGVKGEVPGRSEETEFLERAVGRGARGAYVGTAVALHRISAERFTIGYLYAYGKEKGRSLALLRDHDTTSRIANRRSWAFSLARGLYQLAKRRGDRARQCLVNAGISAGAMKRRSSSGA